MASGSRESGGVDEGRRFDISFICSKEKHVVLSALVNIDVSWLIHVEVTEHIAHLLSGSRYFHIMPPLLALWYGNRLVSYCRRPCRVLESTPSHKIVFRIREDIRPS